MAGMSSDALPVFVPVSVEPEGADPSTDTDRTGGVITIEIGNDLVLRVPGDVPAERAAAVALALRGSA
jgi:transposase